MRVSERRAVYPEALSAVLLACPATKSNHGGLASTLSDGLPERSPPADAQEWSRTDHRVCMFQGPTDGGPDLQHVVWRRTVSLQVIQDLPVTIDISRNRMFCPIGFTGDVRTTFWSYADPVKRAAWNALMRPNVYTDGHNRTVQINASNLNRFEEA